MCCSQETRKPDTSKVSDQGRSIALEIIEGSTDPQHIAAACERESVVIDQVGFRTVHTFEDGSRIQLSPEGPELLP
jgi:hypothetical protein